jgi:frataxin
MSGWLPTKMMLTKATARLPALKLQNLMSLSLFGGFHEWKIHSRTVFATFSTTSTKLIIQDTRHPSKYNLLSSSSFSTSTSSTSSGGFDGTNITESDFEDLADSTLSLLEGALDRISSLLNPEEISCAYGVLTIDLGKRGTWVLNKQTPNKQIWWSSPVSGPRRFAYDANAKVWRWTRDGSITLGQLLEKEINSVAPSTSLKLKNM